METNNKIEGSKVVDCGSKMMDDAVKRVVSSTKLVSLSDIGQILLSVIDMFMNPENKQSQFIFDSFKSEEEAKAHSRACMGIFKSMMLTLFASFVASPDEVDKLNKRAEELISEIEDNPDEGVDA